MYINRLANTFVCFITAFIGLRIFFFLYKKRKKIHIEFSRGLDYFCLFLAVSWISTGLGNFLNLINQHKLEVLLYKTVTGPIMYLHLIPVFFYFAWSFFKKGSLRKAFVIFFTSISAFGVLTLFLYGFNQPEITYWGTNTVPNELSNNIFIFGIFVPGLVCILIEVINRYKKWSRERTLPEKQLFGFSIGFLMYAIAGVFDGLGIAQEWFILCVRTGVMSSLLIFYFFVTSEE